MFTKTGATFITALGTPLDEQGELLEDSFRKHINHQLEHGIDSFLVMGSMGAMVCLKRSAYVDCARAAADEVAGKVKVMVGVGDNSIEQTTERIDLLKGLPIDAVTATTPYYFPSTQSDLVYYFSAIADYSPFPLYLYDLPQITKVKIELETALKLSQHPNIFGAKCSHEAVYVRNLARLTADNDFEVIHGQLDLVDVFLSYGITVNVDGFFAVTAKWVQEIKEAFAVKDMESVSRIQQKITDLRQEFIDLGVFPTFTVAMNRLGFEGRFHPSHMAPMAESDYSKVFGWLEQAELV